MKILTIGFLSALVLIGIGVGVFLGTKTSEEIAPTIEPTQEPTQNPTIEPTNSNPTTKTQTFINKLDEYVHTDDGYYSAFKHFVLTTIPQFGNFWRFSE